MKRPVQLISLKESSLSRVKKKSYYGNMREKELKPQVILNFILAIIFSNPTVHHSFWKGATQFCIISSPLIFSLPSNGRKMAKRMQAEEEKLKVRRNQLDNSPYYMDLYAD